MPKYLVTVAETTHYTYEVEAEDKADAEEEGLDSYLNNIGEPEGSRRQRW